MNTAAVLDRLDTATADLDPPFAAVDVATLRANATDLAGRAKGVPIRVASKSVRCRAVLDLALARTGFRGLMSYALREAIWHVDHGANDVLMGYPTADWGALRDYATDPRRVEAIVLMIDDVAHLDLIRSAVGPDVAPRVCLDVDASLRIGPLHLGVRRSPLRTPAQAGALARAATDRGFRVAGVMTYEAQIAGLPDANLAVRAMKRASARDILRRRRDLVDAVRSVAGPLDLVNSGGTGSIEVSIADDTVTEVTAGSGLYVPTLFDRYRAFTPHPALYFASVVVRRPTPRIATVYSGGYIASGPAGPSRVPRPVRPAGLRLLRSEGAGEVQTPLAGPAAPAVGERVWFRHAKAGELCERLTELHLVELDGSRRTVPTYRGEGQCFG